MAETRWDAIVELENLGWSHQECIAASYATKHSARISRDINKMLTLLQDNYMYRVDKNSNHDTHHASHTDLLVFGYVHSEHEVNYDIYIPPGIKAVCCDFYGYVECCVAFTNPENASQTSNEFTVTDGARFYDKNNLTYVVRKHTQQIDIVEALFLSIVSQHKTCFNYLLRKAPKNPYMCGGSPLYVASRVGNLDFVRLLLQTDSIDIVHRNPHGRTALFMAAFYGYYQIAKLLLESEMERYKIPKPSQFSFDKHLDKKQFFPLFCASQNGYTDIVKLMLSYNADVNQKEPKQHTSLWIASLRGHAEVVELLLSQPQIDIDGQDNIGVTPLWAACQNNHIKVVQLLLKAKANPDLPKPDGCTPCWIAANRGHVEIVKLLIQYGADINKRDLSQGATPLFVACQNNKKEAALALLEAGADINALRSKDGTTPVMMAAHNGHLEIVKELLHYGADIMRTNTTRLNVFGCAAMQGHSGIVKRLYEHLVDSDGLNEQQILGFVDEPDTVNGWTALHLASMGGFVDVMKYMVNTIKVNINRQDHENRTPMEHALNNEQEAAAAWLDDRVAIETN